MGRGGPRWARFGPVVICAAATVGDTIPPVHGVLPDRNPTRSGARGNVAEREVADRFAAGDRRHGSGLRGVPSQRQARGIEGAPRGARLRSGVGGALPAGGLPREQGRAPRRGQCPRRRARRGRVALPRDGAARRLLARAPHADARKCASAEPGPQDHRRAPRRARRGACQGHRSSRHQAREPVPDARR